MAQSPRTKITQMSVQLWQGATADTYAWFQKWSGAGVPAPALVNLLKSTAFSIEGQMHLPQEPDEQPITISTEEGENDQEPERTD